MAARARSHENPVTPQKRGSCDASIKRLEAGCFQVPDSGDRDGVELDAAQLALILSGIDLKTARRRQRFRPAGPIPPKSEENSSERDLHNSNALV
jgi:hypothetical protein